MGNGAAGLPAQPVDATLCLKPITWRKCLGINGIAAVSWGAELRESWQRGPDENTNCLFRRYFSREPTS